MPVEGREGGRTRVGEIVRSTVCKQVSEVYECMEVSKVSKVYECMEVSKQILPVTHARYIVHQHARLIFIYCTPD